MICLCVLRIYWYPNHVWYWALYGAIGLAGVVTFTALEDRHLLRAVARTARLARYGRIVMHSRSLLGIVRASLAIHQDIALRPPFNGWLTYLHSRAIHQWLLETASLAHALDHVVSDGRLIALLNAAAHSGPAAQDARTMDLAIDIPAAFRIAIENGGLPARQSGKMKRLHLRVAQAQTALDQATQALQTCATTPRDPRAIGYILAEFGAQRRKLARANRELRHAAKQCDISIGSIWSARGRSIGRS
jgi:hypothetical protein